MFGLAGSNVVGRLSWLTLTASGAAAMVAASLPSAAAITALRPASLPAVSASATPQVAMAALPAGRVSDVASAPAVQSSLVTPVQLAGQALDSVAPSVRRTATIPGVGQSSALDPILRAQAPTVRRIVALGGRLNVPVGTYSDCTGQSPLFSNAAAVDTCVTDALYFVGHNPGVFSPLTGMSVGEIITWWDGTGSRHDLRIVAIRTVLAANGAPAPVSPDVIAQFQTCKTLDGSVDTVLDTVAADPAQGQSLLAAVVKPVTSTVAAVTNSVVPAAAPVVAAVTAPLAAITMPTAILPHSGTTTAPAPTSVYSFGNSWTAYFGKPTH